MSSTGVMRGTRVKIASGVADGVQLRGLEGKVVHGEALRKGPDGKAEPRVVVRPYLGPGILGKPIDMPSRRLSRSSARVGFDPRYAENFDRIFRRRRRRAAAAGRRRK
jgi:hypothetical protein